jgi:2-polyprenyl-3-methyl-5-hydroxy-6-metoxy-1,4-benzoquinol methylase
MDSATSGSRELQSNQEAIDARNRKFWNELCGSQLAKELGITDSSKESLAKFDAWYLEFYPYLERYVPFQNLKGKKVLEVGLGYGTLSQKIAVAGADYQGLDIAAGPVHMVNQRLSQCGLKGSAVQGSMLQCPFPESTFDWVVAVGCFHHTGNLQGALDETWRVLKSGGRAMIMVYYAYSYRRWAYAPGATIKHLVADKVGLGRGTSSASERERAHYDASTNDGGGAPETAFTSASEMKRLTSKWSRCNVHRENIGQESIFRTWPRDKACRVAGPWVGLDIYCELVK